MVAEQVWLPLVLNPECLFMAYRIAVSAGEVSGDQHLAELVHALLKILPGVELRGMAGRKAEAAGVTLSIDAFRHGSTMGFLELISSLRSIRYSLATMKALIKEWKPHLLVIVDYPDFNLRLAQYAKSHGVKVLYYIPPKVWAWRSGRIPKIKGCTDAIAAIFPFEPQFYRTHGVNHVYYVGNPVADAAKKLDFSECEKRENNVVILAGSRRAEVQRILIPLLKTFEILLRSYSELRATVVVAANMNLEQLQGSLTGQVSPDVLNRVTWSTRDALQEMAVGRLGLLKSGTCNLEAAMVGLPFVCVYSGSRFAKIIVDNFVSLKEYSPVNIIRAGTVPEIAEVTLVPEVVAAAARKILPEGDSRELMLHGLAEVQGALQGGTDRMLTGTSVAERVANLALQLIKGN
jgi:lipid-A-disaccharide synthase